MNDDACCYACNKHVSIEGYGCSKCSFYLHKSCSLDLIEHYRDYKHIQNSFHNHPFEIVYHQDKVSGVVYCNVCGKHCFGTTYICFLCKFYLHKYCLDLMGKIYQNSFHEHPLIVIEKKVNDSAGYFAMNIDSTSCSACDEPCLDKTFACLKCKYYFHESCLELPHEIQHSFHPCPLSL